MRRWLLATLAALVLVLFTLPGAQAAETSPTAASAKTPKTTVSLTFDDGFRDQQAAAKILAKHQMRGTFFIIDGNVGYKAYLTWSMIRSIEAAGNEIGGHTITHPHLADLTTAQATHEICDDRATLLKLGFDVTSFAYPYGGADPKLGKIAKSCGYNSARDVSGLVDRNDCDGCPNSNPLPVADRYRIRANSSSTTLELQKQYVRQAMQDGKGYVPLIFHHICTTCTGITGDEKLSPADFDKLLTWIEDQPSLQVKTVHQVMGGPLRPSVGTPVKSTMLAAAGGLERGGLVNSVSVFGISVGQAQILLVGIIVTIGTVASFRLATRSRRYVR